MPDPGRPRRPPDPANHKDEGFFGSYTTDPIEVPTLARDRIEETSSMAGSVPTPGFWLFGDDEAWFSLVEGYVGSGVDSVTVHTPRGLDVEASVANGRFAAWWPSDQPSSENLDSMGAWTYTVTLDDSSKRQLTG
jgi:hypothetical protein